MASFINRLVSFIETVFGDAPALLRADATDAPPGDDGIPLAAVLLAGALFAEARDFLEALPTDAVPFAPLLFLFLLNFARKALDLDILELIDAVSSTDNSETESAMLSGPCWWYGDLDFLLRTILRSLSSIKLKRYYIAPKGMCVCV